MFQIIAKFFTSGIRGGYLVKRFSNLEVFKDFSSYSVRAIFMDFHKGTLSTPPPFDGNNFQYWKVLMIAFLQALGDEVWYMVETGYIPPTKTVTVNEVASTVPKPIS